MQVLSKSSCSGNKSGSKNCQISEPLRQKVAQTLVNRGALTNIAQDFEPKKIISILDNRRQTTIRNHFFRYSK